MAIVGMTFIRRPLRFHGSMQNTILVGDYLLVINSFFTRRTFTAVFAQREIQRGDIVVFNTREISFTLK